MNMTTSMILAKKAGTEKFITDMKALSRLNYEHRPQVEMTLTGTVTSILTRQSNFMMTSARGTCRVTMLNIGSCDRKSTTCRRFVMIEALNVRLN